ncbi:hypothetical protein ABZP36_031164 [Zizania latifolia]
MEGLSPVEFDGRSVTEKLKEFRENLLHEKARGIIIAALDEVAWLYNIRGDDVHYSPVVHSYAILKGSAVNGSSHGENNMNENSKVWIDSNSCCLALYSKLGEDQVLMLQSPIAIPKAVKSPTELDGLRKAHIRDGAAVVQYLAWLDNQAIVGLWATAVIGGWYNFLTVIYIGFVCAHTLPVLYEKYEDQVDDFLYSCLVLLRDQYKKLDQ